MSRAPKRLGLPLKKDARLRGTRTSMTRLRARAPRGERAFGSVPRNRGKNTVLIASMTLGGAMGECMAVEGSTKGYVFEAYVERFPVPSPRPGQVAVMDNLGAHKTGKVRELIEGAGCGSCRPTRPTSTPWRKLSAR